MLNTSVIDLASILQRAELKPGDRVADLGTGRAGKIALLAGQTVGDGGIVYAVDVIQNILPAIATKAKMHGLNNIQTVWSDLEVYRGARMIRDNTLAAAFLVTVLFQTQKRKAVLQETLRMLRPSGKLIVADWKPGIKTVFGPSEHLRLFPEEIRQYAQELGLTLVEEFVAGPYHWGLVFTK